MIPKPETQIAINDKLKDAERLCDDALTLVCSAAALAISERAFIYTRALIDSAECVERAKCGCFVRIVQVEKPGKST